MSRDHAALDSAIARWTARSDPRLRALAADMRVAMLRERGRLRAARALADSLLAADSTAFPILVLASTRAALADTGVAALFRSSINRPLRLPLDGAQARGFAWTRAHEADVTSPWADTAHLRALADSIELVGARSYYGRDWLLAHHVRGLVAARGGRHAEAVGHLERARYLPAGWTRTNVELAQASLALGRAADAVAVLRDAYTGSHDAMGRYVTRSELDWWMARALAAAGQGDSARLYAARARQAWAQADPEVAARLAALP